MPIWNAETLVVTMVLQLVISLSQKTSFVTAGSQDGSQDNVTQIWLFFHSIHCFYVVSIGSSEGLYCLIIIQLYQTCFMKYSNSRPLSFGVRTKCHFYLVELILTTSDLNLLQCSALSVWNKLLSHLKHDLWTSGLPWIPVHIVPLSLRLTAAHLTPV